MHIIDPAVHIAAMEQSRDETVRLLANMSELLKHLLWEEAYCKFGSSILDRHSAFLETVDAMAKNLSSFDPAPIEKVNRLRKDYYGDIRHLVKQEDKTVSRI